MKRLTSARFVATAALALGAMGVVTAAQARSDVQFSIGVGLPGIYAAPAPIYVEPQPIYVEPQPVYVRPRPVYVQPGYTVPAEVYVNPQPAWGYYGYDRDWRRAEWRRAEWRRREWRRQHEWQEHRGYGYGRD